MNCGNRGSFRSVEYEIRQIHLWEDQNLLPQAYNRGSDDLSAMRYLLALYVHQLPSADSKASGALTLYNRLDSHKIVSTVTEYGYPHGSAKPATKIGTSGFCKSRVGRDIPPEMLVLHLPDYHLYGILMSQHASSANVVYFDDGHFRALLAFFYGTGSANVEPNDDFLPSKS